MHVHSATILGHVRTVRTPGAFWSVDISPVYTGVLTRIRPGFASRVNGANPDSNPGSPTHIN